MSVLAGNVILIHGAWQGSWAWSAFTPYLTAAGFRVVAVDLPGNGCDDTSPADVSLPLYVDHIRAVIAELGGHASLVAHSGGGLVASEVAEAAPHSIDGLVYVAGMMLPSSMAFADLVADMITRHPEVAGIGPHLVWSNDGLTSMVPKPAALAYFLDDCAPALAEAAASRLTPQSERGREVAPTVTAERFGSVPRLYVEASADRSIPPVLQQRMRELVPGAALAIVPTGHAPQVAAPDLLAAAILPFLREVAARAPTSQAMSALGDGHR